MSARERQNAIGEWHRERFPEAQMEHVALKLAEESGEVASAVLALVGKNSATGKGDAEAEMADVLITLFVLMDRWFPSSDLMAEVDKKLAILTTPGAHPASAPAVPSVPPKQKTQ